MANAPTIKDGNITAMTRLDHNRAISQLATQTSADSTVIKKMTIWGNHSATQYPDISQTQIDGKPAGDTVEDAWYKETFIPTVQKRGAAIIEARGLSSAASAANAAIDHNGITEGLIYSFPVTCKGGEYEIVQGLEVSDFSREKMDATMKELEEERDEVKDLL